MASGQVWDSLKAVEAGKVAEALVVRLPNFHPDPSSVPPHIQQQQPHCNTLVVRGEYSHIADYDRVYAAVNIGDVAAAGGGGADPSSDLNRQIAAHVSIRIDPSGKSGGPPRYRYMQACKSSGRWDATRTSAKVFTPSNWPFQEGKPFWLRIILDQRGFFSYVNGKAFSFTTYPPGWRAEDPHNLVTQIPIAGDAGEKATWKVQGMWWGACRVDEAGEKIFREVVATLKETMVSAPSPNEVYVTGLPLAASEASIQSTLMEVFRAYDPVGVTSEGTGSATVTLRGATRTAEAIAATNRRAVVLGSVVNVQQGMKMVPAASLLGFAPAAAGGGGGGGGSKVGFQSATPA
jgi:hypothetical protein